MRNLKLAAYATLALPLTLQAYDKDLETLYPESTMLYGKVDDITRLSEIDKDHPISNLITNEAFKSHIKGAFGEFSEYKEINDEAIAFLTKHCKERASFALLNASVSAQKEENIHTENAHKVKGDLGFKNLSVGAAIDCSATVKEVETFLQFLKEKSPKIQSVANHEFEGVTYWIIENNLEDMLMNGTVTYVALTDELLIITNKKTTLKDFIGKVIAPSKEKTLADSPKYLDTADQLKKYDLSVFARLDQIYKILIEKEETSILNALDNQPQLQMFISKEAVQNDLHLDAFDSAFFGANITEEGGELKSGFSVISKEGIAGLFKYGKSVPQMPDYAFEGFKSIKVSSYDLGGSFNQFEKLISKVSPMVSNLIKSQFGASYDLAKTNFFENIEPYYVTLSGHIDSELEIQKGASKIRVFKIKNEALIHKLVAKMKEEKLLRKLTTLELLGEKVYKIPAKGGTSYYAAVVKNFLVITETSEDEMWRHVISQIKNPGKTIASHHALTDMWDSMKGEEVSRSYSDIGQMILNEHFKRKEILKKAGEPIKEDVPDVKDLNYSLVSKFYQEENFWYSTMKLKDDSPHKK